MVNKCNQFLQDHRQTIEKLISIQKNEGREAIVFMYRDGSTSDIFKGEATHIKLTDRQRSQVMAGGELKGSIHTHPSGFDPSTIDIMTGIGSKQDFVCVATPVSDTVSDSEFIVTCADFSELSGFARRRVFMAMRRSSMGITDLGRLTRKQLNLDRLGLKTCRSEPIDAEDLTFPAAGNISAFQTLVGSDSGLFSNGIFFD